jgi:hypothetical protein
MPNWEREAFLANLIEMAALGTGRIRDIAAWRKAWADAGNMDP